MAYLWYSCGSYFIKYPSNLLKVIKDIYLEAQPPQQSMSGYLQRPRFLAGCLDLHKSYLASGQQYQSIRHPVKSGAHQFWCNAATAFHSLD